MRAMTITPVEISADRINVPEWFFTMSDEDYRAASKAHHAFGSYITRSGNRGVVAVEEIGGALMIHHYEEDSSTPSCLRLTSERTQAWLNRLLPFKIWATVTLEIRPVAAGRSEFVLAIETRTRNLLLRPMAESPIMRAIITRHMRDEAVIFVRDMVEKYR